MSSASRGRRGKRSQKRGARPAPEFRGLGRTPDALADETADTAGYVSGADPDVLADPMATRELVARRRFAFPSTVAALSGDGDGDEVEVTDEDQRELLIVAEHPEYRYPDPEATACRTRLRGL